jgi:hypothetical protein
MSSLPLSHPEIFGFQAVIEIKKINKQFSQYLLFFTGNLVQKKMYNGCFPKLNKVALLCCIHAALHCFIACCSTRV